jgi:pimeloyl-ACP methyl ester carboxylesterase
MGSAGHLATVRLRDGRTIAYSSWGDPDGRPVLNCHGGLVCRLDIATAEATARDLGLRIISPDRPGVGHSDRKPGHALLDWTDDARELVDALGIETCAAFGWSMGGQYALALARALAPRVDTAIVVAGCPPLDNDDSMARLNRMDQRLASLSTKSASMARATFATMRALAGHMPKRFAERSARSLGPYDADVVTRPTTGYSAMVAEGLRQTMGAVDEYRAFVGPWGFTPAEVEVPVQLWWGSDDPLVARELIESLAEALPSCELHAVADAGHFVAFDRWREVLAPLAR